MVSAALAGLAGLPLGTSTLAVSVVGVTGLRWALAISPVALLLALVLWGRLSVLINAGLTVLFAIVVATLAFDSGGLTVAVGLGKGAWVGVWILYVIGPALLMHHLATRIGMAALGRALSRVLPSRTENVLLLAWVLPSFIQGVSGFGTPIAVAAPLLVALGVGVVRAVALPLVGYHWAVGFGSMGSSFYMGSLTARLDAAQTAQYATAASIALGVNCLLAGVLVSLMSGGPRALRESWLMLVTVGPTMALVQAAVAQVEPGIGALCGGAAGIAAVFTLRAVRPARSRVRVAGGSLEQGAEGEANRTQQVVAPNASNVEDDRSGARAAAVPYALLAFVALAVFLPPPMRSWAKHHLLVGPAFPSTSTGAGATNEAVALYNPIALVGHPGSFLLVASGLSVLVWRLRGQWPTDSWGLVWRAALRQFRKSSVSVLLLASVAGVLVDSGMVTTVAQGAAAAAGTAYPFIAPLIGALGSFITGSTTSSNALFAALQAQVADLIHAPPAVLLAGQLAGGNIGNSLAPVVIVLGLSAVGGDRTSTGRVLRLTFAPAAVLLATTVVTTVVLIAVFSALP